MEKRDQPICFRANEEDRAVLAYLQKRLGVNVTQVIKLSIRRLHELEKRREKI